MSKRPQLLLISGDVRHLLLRCLSGSLKFFAGFIHLNSQFEDQLLHLKNLIIPELDFCLVVVSMLTQHPDLNSLSLMSGSKFAHF